MRKKKVTFADIAKYTGFSKTTISRYFNDPDSLTLENQEKLQKHWTSLIIRKTNSQKFSQMERVNLSASLSRTFIYTIILRC